MCKKIYNSVIEGDGDDAGPLGPARGKIDISTTFLTSSPPITFTRPPGRLVANVGYYSTGRYYSTSRYHVYLVSVSRVLAVRRVNKLPVVSEVNFQIWIFGIYMSRNQAPPSTGDHPPP